MKAIDYRNENFEALQKRLHGLRLDVLKAWRTHGPCTTVELAAKSGIGILQVRPRTTELCSLGLVKVCPGKKVGGVHHGIYQAVPETEVRAWFEQQRQRALLGEEQTTLTINQ